jgi:hypothetical protein
MSPRRQRNRPWKAQVQAHKREQAEARQRERESRGDAGQLARLDALLGAGMGAQRERARLQRRLERAA